jgi:hypothetical protein
MGGTQFYVDDLAVIFPLCTDNPLPGDMNKDCYVNFSDLSVFAAHWLSSNF